MKTFILRNDRTIFVGVKAETAEMAKPKIANKVAEWLSVSVDDATAALDIMLSRHHQIIEWS